MLSLEVSIDGLPGLDTKLAALQNSLSFRTVLDESSALLLNRIRTRFLAEEGPNGPWQPSWSGVFRKAGGTTYRNGRGYTGTGTLFETGALFHSIQAFDSGPFERSIGTDVGYAAKLQMEPPYRVFLGFNEEDTLLIERHLLLHLEEELSK